MLRGETGGMRKAQKEQAESFIKVLGRTHEEIRKRIGARDYVSARELLGQCQEGAIKLGELIEEAEGENFKTIPILENYCELVYQIYMELSEDQAAASGRIYRRLCKMQRQVENSIRNDIKVRYEIVFMPYKASMWDSMESVWQAADADPDCDAYVVPIPYYDRGTTGCPEAFHYEGKEFPPYVPVTGYDSYRLEKRMPDVIYIHNPYDHANYVTSVDPRFYSDRLKTCTRCLVYIPYYSTAGGMSEGQSFCPAYYHADYIVVQAEKYRRFFDPAIQQEKLLPLGSPKFDRVLRMCANPPEPPEKWKEKTEGRRVFFYNTSIGGMLADTDAFLKKMEYVFGLFKGREDVCLLWRPHPLMESTFVSMRASLKPRYDTLKAAFMDADLGIYDDTPDITQSIAFSDAYIGDAGTSVTSLFGIAGKPLFLLDNRIHSLPEDDDWRGEYIKPVFDLQGDDRYQVTKNNQLWYSERNDYQYRFCMDLGTGYSGGQYYQRAVGIGDRIYVIPANARNLLIIHDGKIRKIPFKIQTEQPGAFRGSWYNERYLFLFPNRYPLLVRFDLATEELHYVEGLSSFCVKMINGERAMGGIGLYGNELVFASPENNDFLFLDIDTLEARGLNSHSRCAQGTQAILEVGDELWLLPLNGMAVTRWNPETGEVREYVDLPEGFRSVRWPSGEKCSERPFGGMAAFEKDGRDCIVFSPCWGNMYVELDPETGAMTEWKPPVVFSNCGKNGYFTAAGMGGFVMKLPYTKQEEQRIWYAPERKLYRVNMRTGAYEEINIQFDENELRAREPGFMEVSEWMQYALTESAFNSLKDFLDQRITGHAFDRERQIQAFARINVNTGGTCGEEIHRFVLGKLQG